MIRHLQKGMHDACCEDVQAMRSLLVSSPHCINPEKLLLDESALNTIENARNTLAIMRKEAPEQELKLYLVTSEFHCPRSEYIFKNVLDSLNAANVVVEACPAPSGLDDDISDDPKKPMVRDFKVDKIMKDINEWGIFLRLCHEHTIMEVKMRGWLAEYGIPKQDPKHYDRAVTQILDMVEEARQGRLSTAAPKSLRA